MKSSYNTLDIPALLNVVGKSSFYNGIMLFDNIEENGDTIPNSEIPFTDKPMKLHSNIVLFCLEGRLDCNMDCRESLSVHAGEIAVFIHGQIAEFKQISPGAKIIMIAASSDIKTSMELVADTCARFGIMSHTPDTPYADIISDIYRLMKKLIDGAETRHKGRILSNYLDILYLTLNESLLNNASRQSVAGRFHHNNRQTEIYHTFVNLVKEQFRQHRDVEYYAKALCLSSGHLSRIVKNQSGKTVAEWIKEYIILEAKVLLKSSTDAVYQISDTLNFPNTSFFCKYFKDKTGLTPNQYRNH